MFKITYPNEEFKSKFQAMAIGNIMEWFDFASFGALADVIGYNYFPNDVHDIQLLKSLSIFGAAFVMRPLGGTIIGYIGDHVGRKKALEISVLLMLLTSFCIGILPTYHSYGYSMTSALVLLRLLQGLACGGEIVGAFIYTIEATDGINNGFWGGLCKATGNTGSALGLGFVAILRIVLSQEQMYSWGWRLPFVLSILFGIVGLKLRAKLADEESIVPHNVSTVQGSSLLKYAAATMVYNTHDENRVLHPQQPVQKSALCGNNWREILCSIFVTAFWGCGYYSAFVWMSYFMSNPDLVSHGYSTAKTVPNSWIINFIMNCCLVVVLPVGGRIGDYFNRINLTPVAGIVNVSSPVSPSAPPMPSYPSKFVANDDLGYQQVMIIGLIITIMTAIPAFGLICTCTEVGALVGQGLFVIGVGLFGGNLPAFLVSQFDPEYRYSAIGIAYNVAHALFSGTAPLIQTYLVLSSNSSTQDRSDSSASRITLDFNHDSRLRPAYYLISVAVMTLFVLVFAVPHCRRLKDLKTAPRVEALSPHITADDIMDSTTGLMHTSI